jgi:S-adenosylmethionine-diacylglycerol 3-amino-3-carboxypropyl transferase
MAGFFRTLNYASVNEDWRTEATALRLEGGERVLCVTGSGARALDLLAAAPVRVLAVDRNPAQSHLLRLKQAAIEALPYDEYAAFLGLRPASGAGRRDTLRRLGSRLPAEARRFWGARPGLVARGVLYEGRWERFHRRLARVTRLLQGRRVRALLAFEDLDAQRAWVERHWDEAGWRRMFAVACSRPVVRTFFGDPAYCAHAALPAGRLLHARMGALLERVLARDSFMAGLVLTGTLPPRDLPPHLTEAGHRTIRARLGGLDVATAEVTSLLESSPPGGFDRFSLSDVASFLDSAGFGRLVAAVARAAAPGARVVLRQFLTRHTVPAALQASLIREPALEARLAVEDRSFAYEFLVAEVAGA